MPVISVLVVLLIRICIVIMLLMFPCTLTLRPPSEDIQTSWCTGYWGLVLVSILCLGVSLDEDSMFIGVSLSENSMFLEASL